MSGDRIREDGDGLRGDGEGGVFARCGVEIDELVGRDGEGATVAGDESPFIGAAATDAICRTDNIVV